MKNIAAWLLFYVVAGVLFYLGATECGPILGFGVLHLLSHVNK